MGKGKAADDKPKAIRTARSEAEAEALFDALDRATLGRDEKGFKVAVERLMKAGRHVPEVLTRRIVAGRVPIPGLAFGLLGAFAGEQTPRYLKRIADDPSAADIVRFGAKRRVGWPERGQAKRRLNFLGTLRDAEGTLVEAIGQATESWPPTGDILEEVLDYLVALPAERREAVIARATNELGDRAAMLLQALVHVPDPATQRLVLGELVRLRALSAVGPIERLAATTRNAEIKGEATAALQRLRMHTVDRPRQTKPLPLPPVERALLSMIDGDGGQVIIVVRGSPEGLSTFADVFWNDHWGIKDAFGKRHAMPGEPDDIIDDLEEEGVPTVAVDVAAVRGTLATALAVNSVSGRPVPPAFEIWEPFVHESYPPAQGDPVTMPELDDAPYAKRNDLVRKSGQLAAHPFFTTWTFDVGRVARAIMLGPLPTGGRLTDRQYRPLIQRLADPDMCARLRQRLRRQAWLLDRYGDKAGRDLALAVAAQLADGRAADLVGQPFLRAMVQTTVSIVLDAMVLRDLEGIGDLFPDG